MTHYHLELVRTTPNSEIVERIGKHGWLTAEAAEIEAGRVRMFHPDSHTVRVSAPCACPAGFDESTSARLLESLHDRVQAIEARQRAAGTHDPGCPAQPQVGFDNLIPRSRLCNCWLSTSPETP